jgi:hypothetical protein
MASRLRSRRLLYRTTFATSAMSGRDFRKCFTKALSSGMQRVRMSGEVRWLGKAVLASAVSSGGRAAEGGSVFTEFEVYLILPEGCVPGRVRNWLSLGERGWSHTEELPKRSQQVALFFDVPLNQWKRSHKSGSSFGPGLGDVDVAGATAAVATDREAEASSLRGGGESAQGSDVREEVQDGVQSELATVVAGEHGSPFVTGRLWTEKEIEVIVLRAVRQVLAAASGAVGALAELGVE